MPNTELILLVLSLLEIAVLVVVTIFIWRLKASENVMRKLQDRQSDLLNKLRFNAQIEQELMATFEKRQNELIELDAALEKKSDSLRRLLKQAEEIVRSPVFLREVIVAGHRQGKPPRQLARESGLSLEEVELILEQAG